MAEVELYAFYRVPSSLFMNAYYTCLSYKTKSHLLSDYI